MIMLCILLFASCSWAKSGTDVADAEKAGASFQWRSIYSPTSAADAKENPKTSMHVDWCWGLWGHNLKKIFVDYKGDDIFAMVNGRRDKNQYCFSAPDTYKCIEQYIIDQYGEGSSSYHERICIIPNDNKTVCQCVRCQKMGCTKTSATPAVATLVAKLAKRFPKHQFFMAGYHTTIEAPRQQMPENVGVFLSTMDIPMRYIFNESNGFKKFDARLKAWQKVMKTIYVWEYNRNYDDYLSPYPCLSILQKRLKYYHDNGITGVFINGSGYDYSSFDDIQTAVLNDLMVNIDQDVDRLIERHMRQLYPQTADSLLAMYLSMERSVRDKNTNLPYYGTVEDELTYIHPDTFNRQWKNIDRLSKEVQGDERKRLSQLLTALSFTRMELTRITGDQSEFYDILEVLSEFFETSDMQNYREANGLLDHYVTDCRKLHRAPGIHERR